MTSRGHSLFGPGTEIETLDAFDATGEGGLDERVVQSVDLRERTDVLRRVSVRNTIFLGCQFAEGVDDDLHDRGALLFPRLPDLPFNPYRPRLYDARKLYDAVYAGQRYEASMDARTYAWSRSPETRRRISSTLATSLHDHAIGDALDELFQDRVDPELTVGIMGGHATLRSDASYAQAADLAEALAARGRTIVTGGGPGAMEAANLGARLVGRRDDLDAALASLRHVPRFHHDITRWARVALDVLESVDHRPDGPLSIGIPTWFYGHEPPNVFATHIAKFFSNALREDTLLHRCRGGIVYLPGAAGTVQEIFQAATGNYYAPTSRDVAPMVLVGVEYWTTTFPAWPLLESLAAHHHMARHVHLVDSPAEAVGTLVAG